MPCFALRGYSSISLFSVVQQEVLNSGAHPLSTHGASEDSVSVSMVIQTLFVW